MGNCKSNKRSNSFDDKDNEKYNKQKKGKNKKKGKENSKKQKNLNSKEELNERSRFNNPEENLSEKNEKETEHKSPEREVIADYESQRPSIKIVTRKTINNSTILIGLANIGATCYMNATLQCLSNTDKLTNFFLKEFKYDKADDTKKISNQYYRLIHHLWNKYTDKKDYAPKHFKEVLSEVNPLFSGINANDSKDLLNFLLETIHKELNNAPKEEKEDNDIGNNINQFNEEDIKQSFFKDFAKRYRSIISDLFYFTFEIKSQCCNCKYIKYNFQVSPFLEFPLEQVNQYLFNNGKIASLTNMDGSNPDINLYDCFEYNQKVDLMNEENQMYCNLCNNSYDSYYSTTLYLLPEILIINLNRGKNAVYQCNVNFPEELNLTNYVINKEYNTQYELYAVICHIGPSSMSGHFVAYCRNRMDNQWYLYNDSIDNQWYLYNDSIVTLCEKSNEYLNKMPYILFYKSKNLNKNNIENNNNVNNIINQNNLNNQNQNIINDNNNINANNNMNNHMANNMSMAVNMNNNMNYNMNNGQVNNYNMINMNDNYNNNMNNNYNNNMNNNYNNNMNNNYNNNMNIGMNNNIININMNNSNGINNNNNMNNNNNINNINDMNNINGTNNNNSMNNIDYSNGMNNMNYNNNMNNMNYNNNMNYANGMNYMDKMNNNNINMNINNNNILQY